MTESQNTPVAGFMSPPGWLDPSPEEFRTILDGEVIIQQTMMPIYNFVFGKIANIAGTLPEMLYCSRQLGSAESDVIAHTGTPFGWAGLATEKAARDRCALLVDAAGGVPVIMAGLAILDGLRALGAEKLAISTPYYTQEWKDAWSAIVASGGFDIQAMKSMDEQGLVPTDGNIDDHGWIMKPKNIIASAVKVAQECPDAQAVVITGAGARTMTLTPEIEKQTGLPVLASDTALFWAMAKELGVPLKPGSLGQLTAA
jgi:maleate cis-trans isomerase